MGNKFSAVNGVRSANFYEPGNGVNEIWVGDLEIVSRLPFGDSDMAQAGWPKGDYPKFPWRPFIIPLKGTAERAVNTISTSISELSRRTNISDHVAAMPSCLSRDRLDWIVLKLLSIPFFTTTILIYFAPHLVSSRLADIPRETDCESGRRSHSRDLLYRRFNISALCNFIGMVFATVEMYLAKFRGQPEANINRITSELNWLLPPVIMVSGYCVVRLLLSSLWGEWKAWKEARELKTTIQVEAMDNFTAAGDTSVAAEIPKPEKSLWLDSNALVSGGFNHRTQSALEC